MRPCSRLCLVVKQALGTSCVRLLRETHALQVLQGTGLAPGGPRLDLSQERHPGAVLCYDWVEGTPLAALTAATAPALGRALAGLHHLGGGSPRRPPVEGVPCRPAALLRELALEFAWLEDWRQSVGLPADPLVDRLGHDLLRGR